MIKIKEYNNKSRKGKYVYIKGNKGEAPRIIRYYEGVPLAHYEIYHNKKKGLREKGIKTFKGFEKVMRGGKGKESRIKRNVKRAIRNIYQKSPQKIDREFNRGISENIIKDIIGINYLTIRKEVKKLFSKYTTDKDFLNILTQEQNMEKLKRRFSYRATYISNNGENIAEVTSVARYSPNEIIRILTAGMSKGMRVDYKRDLGRITSVLGENALKMKDDVKSKGYRLGSIKLQINFTKQKTIGEY